MLENSFTIKINENDTNENKDDTNEDCGIVEIVSD